MPQEKSESSKASTAPGQAGAEPSGPHGDSHSTAGPGATAVRSSTPENSAGKINPSPEDSNITPGTDSAK